MNGLLKFIEVFTRPGISMEDQTNLIDDLSRRRIPLEKSFRSNVVHATTFAR